MNEIEARKILGDAITKDGLHNLGPYIDYTKGESSAVLDGEFSLKELKAIAWWMKNG